MAGKPAYSKEKSMKHISAIFVALFCVTITGCNESSNVSTTTEIDDVIEIVKIKMAAQTLEEAPFIVGNDGCYWAMGERKGNAEVVAVKIMNSNGKQLCISKEDLAKRKSAEASAETAATGDGKVKTEYIDARHVTCTITIASKTESCDEGNSGTKTRTMSTDSCSGVVTYGSWDLSRCRLR